jgi:signal transduction histidine kinase
MNVLDRLAERPYAAANAGLAAVFTAVLAVEAHVVAGYGGAWGFDLAVGLVVCAAALLRSRSRAWAAAAGLAVCAAAEPAAWRWHLPGQPGGAAVLAVFVLIGSAVRTLPVRAAAAVVAGGAVVAAGTIERYLVFIDRGTPCSFAATWMMTLGCAAAAGTGLWWRALDARRRAMAEAVRRDERLELARELHDTAAHHITGIVLQAQAARIAARTNAGTLDDTLAGIESAGTDALTSMRRVIGLLRDADDAAGVAPGPGQLAELVARFAGRGPAVRLRLPDGPADPGWPPEVNTTVCRVVQEALTNIVRHAAGAREVTVALSHDRRAITVEVTDDAPPAGPNRFPRTGGYGLVGMRERVEALGGTLRAGPAPAAGWSVRATLPAPGRP